MLFGPPRASDLDDDRTSEDRGGDAPPSAAIAVRADAARAVTARVFVAASVSSTHQGFSPLELRLEAPMGLSGGRCLRNVASALAASCGAQVRKHATSSNTIDSERR